MDDNEQIAAAARLRRFHPTDPEERLRDSLRRWIEDPVKPRTDKGNLRVNGILVLLSAMALLAGATFLLFSFVQL
jgi:hypothetical protein